MKVIFLDFDGVLNSEKYLRKVGGHGVAIDPTRMELLKQIVLETGAKIVLSTSWRAHWSKLPEERDPIGNIIEQIFESHGLALWDKTPQMQGRRETHLKSFLDMHPEVESFVVLDDMLLYADYLKGHIVKTAGYLDGLDEADVKKAIEILGNL